MKRFTIRTLMAFVVVTAVGLAGLRNATELWAGALLLVTLGLLLASVLGAIYSAGPSRAGWLGFSLFGFAYLALTMCPIDPERLTGALPTSQLLDYVNVQVSPPQVAMGGGAMMSMMYGGMAMGSGMQAYGSTVTTPPPAPSPPAPPSLWKTLLPGAANDVWFACIGHCLFALLAGLAGAVIARGFEKRRVERA